MKTSGNHCWLPFLFINKLVFETVNRYYSTHAEYTYIYGFPVSFVMKFVRIFLSVFIKVISSS